MPIHYGVPDEESQPREGDTRTADTRTAATRTADTRTAGTRTSGPSWVRTGMEPPRFDKVEPPATRGARPSPALDPLARMRVSAFAKWLLLLGIMLFALWYPLHTKTDDPQFWLDMAPITTTFAAVIATGLPRSLLPTVFGQWHEAVEAFRDWLVVGLTTGFLFRLGIGIIQASTHAGEAAHDADTYEKWLSYRLPVLILSAVVGVLASRMLTIRSQGILNQRSGNAFFQVLVQLILLGAFWFPFQTGLKALHSVPNIVPIVQDGMIGCGAVAALILIWAFMADSRLMALQKGVVSGSGPVELTLTVIGGRNAGKTVLLAAAFYEWTTQSMGNLRIASAVTQNPDSRGTDLQKVANDLYINREFPVGSVVCQDLPFELYLGPKQVAKFRFLDYPGGAFVGRATDPRFVEEFYSRVDETDGVLLVADMSYVRLGKKDDDWMEIRNAFRTVLQRLQDRNGRNRVVPVALVMTKCDEFVDPNTGRLRMADLEDGLRFFQYLDLEEEWRRMCQQTGPGISEFTIWFTSAITYSMPRYKNDDPNEDYDMVRGFTPVPPPAPIEPSGCAAPLLWLSAKVMRWNVTMFRDLSSFILGSSPAVRQRIDAVVELERIANVMAAQVKD